MEILKRTIVAICCLLSAGLVYGQNEAAVQKAFKESYTQEAAKAYTEAIAPLSKVYDEGSYELNLRLGWLYYMNKNYNQSMSFYQKAVALKPYSIEAKLGLIYPLSALESWDKTLLAYEDILKVDAQNYTANYWAGVIYYNRKDYAHASRLFEKIVNLYPFDYDGNHMMGWTCFYLGKLNDAKLLFNKALMSRPGDASATEGLGKIK